jgi:hypothetical protein
MLLLWQDNARVTPRGSYLQRMRRRREAKKMTSNFRTTWPIVWDRFEAVGAEYRWIYRFGWLVQEACFAREIRMAERAYTRACHEITVSLFLGAR